MTAEQLRPAPELEPLDADEIEHRKSLIHEVLMNGVEDANELHAIRRQINDVLHKRVSYGSDGGASEVMNRSWQRLMDDCGLTETYDELINDIDDAAARKVAQHVTDVNDSIRTQSQFEVEVHIVDTTYVITEVTALNGRIVPLVEGIPLDGYIDTVSFRDLGPN